MKEIKEKCCEECEYRLHRVCMNHSCPCHSPTPQSRWEVAKKTAEEVGKAITNDDSYCTCDRFSKEKTCEHTVPIPSEWEKRLEFNCHDFGEMGKFIRQEYVYNIISQVETEAYERGKTALAEAWTNAKVAEARQSAISEIIKEVEDRKCNPGDIVTGWVISMDDLRIILSKLKEKLQ